MGESRISKVHGKRLPNGTYELRVFVDGQQVVYPFIHEDGSPLLKERALYSDWDELLSAHETSDGTLICPMSDIDRFIDAVGMKRVDISRRYDMSSMFPD